MWNCSTNELITTLTPNTNKQNEQNFISVDTAGSDRIYEERYTLADFFIKMDHHIAVENFGDIDYVDTGRPAATLIILDLFKTDKFPFGFVPNDTLLIKLISQAVLLSFNGFAGSDTYTGYDYNGIRAIKLGGTNPFVSPILTPENTVVYIFDARQLNKPAWDEVIFYLCNVDGPSEDGDRAYFYDTSHF